jgi:hypothetical protein
MGKPNIPDSKPAKSRTSHMTYYYADVRWYFGEDFYIRYPGKNK